MQFFINWHLIWFDYFMFFRKKWFNVWRCWLFGWFHELTWNLTRQDNKDSDQKKNIWPEKGEFSNNFKFTILSDCLIWDYIGFALCYFAFDLEIVPHKAKNMYMFLSLASQYVSYIFLLLLSTSFGSQYSISKIAFYVCNVKW